MDSFALSTIHHIPDCLLKEIIGFLAVLHPRSLLSVRLVDKRWLRLCNDMEITFRATSRYIAVYSLLEYVKRNNKGHPIKQALRTFTKWCYSKNRGVRCLCLLNRSLDLYSVDDLYFNIPILYFNRHIPKSISVRWEPLFGAPELTHDRVQLLNFDTYSAFEVNIKTHTKEEMVTFISEEVRMQATEEEISLFELLDCNLYLAHIACTNSGLVHSLVGIDFTINKEISTLSKRKRKRCIVM